MGKHRLGWPDLLLIGGLALALNGFFYAAMTSLAVYALLYRRATVLRRRFTDQRMCGCRWRREDRMVIYTNRCGEHELMCRPLEQWELELTADKGAPR